MKAKLVNETLSSVLAPLSSRELVNRLKGLSQEEKNDKLVKASTYGDKKIVKILLKVGADVNAEDNSGWTSLMWASRNACKELVELLLEAGADVNAKDKTGLTSLIWASRYEHKEIVNTLLKAGAYINDTVFMFALSKDIKDIFSKYQIDNKIKYEYES